MWARVVEAMLGCWMAVSPFVFQHQDGSVLWAADLATAAAVISLALLSYWEPLRHAHLGIAVVALVMIVFGRLWHPGEVGPGFQNHMVVGLLLAMFAIVPNYAGRPPRAWDGRRGGPRAT
jgi:hypothetical protein